MKTLSKKLGLSALALAFVTLMTTSLLGQGFEIEDPEQIEKQREQEFKSELGQYRKQATRQMKMRIAEMDRICDLDDKQIVKLKLASKGAVESAAGKMSKLIKQMQMGFMGEAELPAVDPENEEDTDKPDKDRNANEDEDEGEDEGDADQKQGVMFMVDPFSQQLPDPVKTKIWKTNVAKVLSKVQQKKYGDHVARRAKFKREASVKNFVASVDEVLLLSDEQRSQLLKYADKNHGDLLIKFGGEIYLGGPFGLGIGELPKTKADEKLKSILNKSQLEIWEFLVAPQLAMIKGEGLPFGGAIIGAAPEIDDEEK